MYYQAKIYIDSVVINTIIANTLEVLKSKCKLWIEDKYTTSIEVSKVQDIGYFKVPKGFEDVIEDGEVL